MSRYDDFLTLQQREGYEPGDTLALVVPFFIASGITSDDIRRVSARAKVIDGAKELVYVLRRDGWKVFVISTSYEQHAYNIGKKIGVPPEDIGCTRLELETLASALSEKDIELIKRTQEKILALRARGSDEARMVEMLDRFFFEELPHTGYGSVLERVRVVGGSRKVEAVRELAQKSGAELSDVVVVGDSITDYKMLDYVRAGGGLSVAFNGNEYSVPYAGVGLATTDMRFLKVLTDAVQRGDSIEDFVRRLEAGIIPAVAAEQLEELSAGGARYHFSYLAGADTKKIKDIVCIHREFRSLVRGAAAKLG